MILKCGNGIEWDYVDGIKSIVIKPDDKTIAPNSKQLFIPMDKDLVQAGMQMIHKMAIINFGDDNGEIWNISAPLIYLLSDEGKTIERIN